MVPRLFGGSQFCKRWPCLAESRVVEGAAVVSGRRGVAGGHDSGRGAVKRCLFRRTAAWECVGWVVEAPLAEQPISGLFRAPCANCCLAPVLGLSRLSSTSGRGFVMLSDGYGAILLVPPRRGWLLFQQRPRGAQQKLTQ
jgi:hypothetical protein